MKRLLASAACFLALLSGCKHPAPMQQAHSRASLVVEQSAAIPGTKVNVGIQFVTDGGWHIYWQNPGDSGEPPRMQWQLPAGITAGPLEWPTPTRMTTSAGTDYGYQGTTVLLTSLEIPNTAQLGTLEVGGDLRWLVCHDICIPQSAHLKAPLQLASAANTNEPAHKVLQSASEFLPKPLAANMRVVVTKSPDGFRLTTTSKEPITRVEFFPADVEQIENGAPQELARNGDSVSLALKKSEYLRQEPEHLRGVLVLNGGDAYQVDVPVQSAAKRSGKR